MVAGVRRLPPVLQNLLLSASTVILFLGAAEGICRLMESAHPAPRVAAYITPWENWEDGFYTVQSTAVGWPPWEDYNSEGLRDRERTVEKPPGVRRVICLGDSTTLGWGIPPQEAYPQVLEDLLESMGGRVEVFNVALGGWSTRQERIAYERIARRYQPDAVLLGICLNDIPELQNNLTRPPALVTALHRRSALVRRLVRAQGREIADVEELFSKKDSPKVREAFDRLFAEVRRLREEVRADGAAFALLVFPFRLQVAPGAPPATAQQAIAEFCRAEKITCLDLLPTLRAAGPDAFIDYDHFSRTGARVVAERVLSAGLSVEKDQQEAGGPAGGASLSVPVPAGASLPVLLGALRQPDEGGQAAAARALGNLGPAAREAVPELMKLLERGTPRVRAATARALGNMGPAAELAVHELMRRLDDAAPPVRAAAAWALGEIGPAAKAALLPLVNRLRDEDESVRLRAGESLGQVRPDTEEARQALVAIVEDVSAPGRAEAAAALGKLGPDAQFAVAALVKALDDPRAGVRGRAVLALGEIGPGARAAVPALLVAFRDAGIRWRVADALGAIGPDAAGAVPDLTAALQDPSSNVRWRAAQALGAIGPGARRAVPALVQALGDPFENVRLGAVVALDKIGLEPRSVLPACVRALRDEDGRVRARAARALGRLGPIPEDARRALTARLTDEDDWVRVEAARALKKTTAARP
jgi:HEAT repeat protein/lysophospholipase L1-like esterase